MTNNRTLYLCYSSWQELRYLFQTFDSPNSKEKDSLRDDAQKIKELIEDSETELL